MKFALINNQRCEATPKTKGICPVCNTPVIAKCGTLKAHHWAHETKQNCRNDRWETEGPWHRNWKNCFPETWQEKIITVNGEKNIADIQTEQGLVVEFQHSHITPEEQKARENCYKDMIWVVDGTRLKYDFSRFKKKIKKYSSVFLKTKNNLSVYYVEFYDECFPKNWLKCSAPVIFDFLDLEEEKNADVFQKYLYCLLPIKTRGGTDAFLFYISRKDFVPAIMNNEWQVLYNEVSSRINEIEKAKALYYKQQAEQRARYNMRVAENRILNKYRRRF